MKRKFIKALVIVSFIIIIFFILDDFLDNSLTDFLNKGYKKTEEALEKQKAKLKKARHLNEEIYDINDKLYSIFFTRLYNGNHKIASGYKNSIDRHLIRALKKAKSQVYAAVHELDSKIITDAILSLYERGVEVKILTESKYINEESIIRLRKAGIPIMDDSSAGKSRLMHNKFFVIDGKWVWTGSFNPTYNGSYKNNNNAILIYSRELAYNFLSEFKEMFFNKKFGRRSPKEIKYKSVNLGDNTTIKAFFAPENDVAKVISNEIKNAKNSIYFMAFSFTHNNIAKAMINKHKDGLKVMGIFEKRQNNPKYSMFYPMNKAGIMVRNDKNKYNMHHKVIIIDERLTILGSFNFSKNADKRNDENILIISNANIAKKYIGEFKRLYYK